jgi:hypothetical protein
MAINKKINYFCRKSYMKRLILLLLSLFFFSCSPKIVSNFSDKGTPLSIDDKVALLNVEHEVPENAIKKGDAKFLDSGFTTDCSFDSHLTKARRLARENGANIVKVTQKKDPNILTTCSRIEVDFYYYDGDISQLSQYYITIK